MANATPEASPAPEVVPVASVFSETISAIPEESAAGADAGAPVGIDCNVEAAAP